MPSEITMPQMGADMTEGTVVRWLKQVGDTVTRGEIIAEIETDKATVELEAFESGTLRKIVVQEGETVPVGDVIAILADEGEEVPDVEPKPSTGRRRHIEPATSGDGAGGGAEVKQREEPSGPEPAPAAATAGGRLRVSPVARRIAEEHGVDLTAIQGTGPDGRILRRDVEAALRAAEKAPAQAPVEEAAARRPAAPEAGRVEPLSRMRQTIARRMSESKQRQPHYYLTVDVDMTDAMEFRKRLNDALPDERRVTVNDLIVKACALALRNHPKFNAEYTDEGIRFHGTINIAIGIALDEGLIAPALLDCGNKTLGRIAEESKDLVERAKSGKLRADEYGSGTFTITNLGAYGVESLIGIINPPMSAILGVGSVMAKPAVYQGQIAIRQLMKIALSADHRVTDGAEGARFIKEIQSLLENPTTLAL
ncbi:MAG: pyruvate dehydrogenase complex dihydrolipoamide acetyltransferase [Dehalococcoidia bacterium]